jgi:hypothetical protein
MKQNILTIKQNTWGSRSGYGLISTPVMSYRMLVFPKALLLPPALDLKLKLCGLEY